MEYNLRNCVHRRQVSKSKKNRSSRFLHQLSSFQKKLSFQIFDLQKVGQGHGVQLSRRCPSMANINLQKLTYACLRQREPFQRYQHLKCLNLKSMSRSWSTTFVIPSVDGKRQHLSHLSTSLFTFCLLSYDLCERLQRTDTQTHIHRNGQGHGHNYVKSHICLNAITASLVTERSLDVCREARVEMT